MTASLVSIYMPTRNRAVLLERAVNSVLDQTYEHLELLIVDDGSSDNTSDVLRSLSSQDSRVRFFVNKESLGAPAARNLAIENASGKWITGLDDDDWFSPRRVELLVGQWRLMENAGVAFSGLYSQDFYEGRGERNESKKRGALMWTDLFEYNSIGNQLFTLTDRFRAIGMFDIAMPAWQDLDLFIRILKEFGSAKLVDVPLYHLNVDDRPDRISNSGRVRITAAFERLKSKYPDLEKPLIQMLYLQRFGKLYGQRPTPADVLKFFSYGYNFKNTKRFASCFFNG